MLCGDTECEAYVSSTWSYETATKRVIEIELCADLDEETTCCTRVKAIYSFADGTLRLRLGQPFCEECFD